MCYIMCGIWPPFQEKLIWFPSTKHMMNLIDTTKNWDLQLSCSLENLGSGYFLNKSALSLKNKKVYSVHKI